MGLTTGEEYPINPRADQDACLYYEVHINIPLTVGDRRSQLNELAREHRFKLSDMDGHDHGDKLETILTTHGQDYNSTAERTKAMCVVLAGLGFVLIRYKIERAVLDSRINDIWGLIS
jgi:hypothetical protein